MRVAIYTRVSTSEQNNEIQLNDLNEYVERRKLGLPKYYNDVISGAKSKRPGLDQLLDDVRKRKIDMVLVWRFDRFARSTSFLLKSLEEFKALGVQFVSYQENVDTSTPMGQAMFSILSAVAQLERDILIERVSAGMRNARAKGVKLGRKEKISYAQATALKAQGLSLREIAAQHSTSAMSVMRALKRVQ